MSYLTAQDYKKQIQDANLQQVINSDATIQADAELAAEEEIRSYLSPRYDLSKEFSDITTWDAAKTYNAGDRVQSGTDLFYASYPAPVFDYTTFYNVGDVVFWKNHTYKCLVKTQTIDSSTALQYGSLNELPLINIFPDIDSGTNWQDLGAYIVAAGTATTDTTKWTKGDTRNALLKMYAVDLVLYHVHSRIAPRNIPDLRKERYYKAIEWLKEAEAGKVTVNIPMVQVHKGSRIRYGGAVKVQNNY